jgi:hypothetical protein
MIESSIYSEHVGNITHVPRRGSNSLIYPWSGEKIFLYPCIERMRILEKIPFVEPFSAVMVIFLPIF